MRVLAIDPGSQKSALCLFSDGVPGWASIEENNSILRILDAHNHDRVVIEMIASYGMGVGKEVFDTCLWIGRFIQICAPHHELIFRKDVKLHLCGTNRATDSNIRYALLDRFGPGKDRAVGTKKAPGPLYGLKKDMWSALAIAVTYADQKGAQ